jgi:hypothetical protein
MWCVKLWWLQIRIDHKTKCIHFGMDLSESQREDKPEGPTLQSMPSEQVRNQLVNMATVLHRAMATINPHKKRVSMALHQQGNWENCMKCPLIFLCLKKAETYRDGSISSVPGAIKIKWDDITWFIYCTEVLLFLNVFPDHSDALGTSLKIPAQ